MAPQRPNQRNKPPVQAKPRDANATRRRDKPEGRGASSTTKTKYSLEQKLDVFSNLFRGRPDVYPVRWENSTGTRQGYMPACSNKFVRSLCDIQRTKCSKCPNQNFEPFNREVIEKHLRGELT